jgi:hypothetical protein
MMKPSPRNRDLIFRKFNPNRYAFGSRRKELFWQITFPEIRLGQWEGFVQDKGRQRNFSLLLFWLINAVMKRLRLLRLFYLHLKVCQINRIVVLNHRQMVSIWILLSIIIKLPASAMTISGDPVLFRHIAFLDQNLVLYFVCSHKLDFIAV